MPVDLRQTHFRFGKDDGTESGHTFWQLEDVNHTQLITADWTFLLRFTEQEVGGTAAGNVTAALGRAWGIKESGKSELISRIIGGVQAAEKQPPPGDTGGGGSWGPDKPPAPTPPVGSPGGGVEQPPVDRGPAPKVDITENPNDVSQNAGERSMGANVGDRRDFGGYQWKWDGTKWDREQTAEEKAYNALKGEEDRARQAAEQKLKRFNALVVPVQKDVESFLESRKSLTDLFNEQLTEQGVPEKEKTLQGFESDVQRLQGQLSTIPGEEIARRRETGMISAAAERRIRATEERPIREQLLGVTSASESQRVGLQRAYDLIDKWLDIFQEQEKRELAPIESRLEAAKGEFQIESDGIASQLTGFTNDRKSALAQLNREVDARRALTKQQTQELADLQKLEIEHAYTMEEQLAKQRGEKPREFEVEAKILNQLRDDVIAGGSLQEVSGKYLAQGVEPDVILNLFNSNTKSSPVSVDDYKTKYGITSFSKQVPSAESGGGGSPI